MGITNVMEYQAIAKQKLPKMVYDYYASGAEDEWTLNENREAFSRILFRPRILIDVSKIDISTTVLGFKISMPIMIAPTAMQKMAHPDGEYATARAASAANTIMTLSSWATSSVEEVASTGPGIRFFQLYVYKDRKVVEQLVRRAERAGFKAIALTVDTPRLGRREADIKNRFVLPPHLTLKNFEGLDLGKMDQAADSGLASYVAGQIDRTLSWKDVKWLQTITTLPILVKGVVTAEDSSEACGGERRGGDHRVQPRRAAAGLRAGDDQRAGGGREGGPRAAPCLPRRRRPPRHRRLQGARPRRRRHLHREAGGVLAGGGGGGGRVQRAQDDAGRVRAHHGAQRLHLPRRHHPQPHRHRVRQAHRHAVALVNIYVSLHLRRPRESSPAAAPGAIGVITLDRDIYVCFKRSITVP
ncbi:unnamed protein product [Urochloa humidicola]